MRIKATAAIALAASLALAGCASGPAAQRPNPAAKATTPGKTAPPSTVAQLCGPPNNPGNAVTVRAADGVRLAAIDAGTGTRGIVLIPELGAKGKCGWWTFAAYLAARGYHVLAFDHRCTGGSACATGAAQSDLMADIRGAVTRLRQDGAAKVALVGASQGGSEALIAGTAPAPEVTGVVALSADELTTPLAAAPYPATAQAAAPRLRLPALFAVAAADPNVSAQDTRDLFARTGSRHKHLDVVSGVTLHGWDLVTPALPGATPPPLSATVLAFLRGITA